MIRENDKITHFRNAVRLIDLQRRQLNEASADKALLDALEAIIRHLNRLSETQMLGIVAGREERKDRKLTDIEEARVAAGMTLEEIENVLSSEKAPKARLEAIAVGRFKVPRGSLRSIGNIEKLRDKLATLARNERAHETIHSVAQERKP
jgi:hypothetical protein